MLREVIDQWCEASGAGGEKFKMQLTIGLVTVRELILRRSAVRKECLRAAFSFISMHDTSGLSKLSEITVKMITNTLYSRNAAVDGKCQFIL